MISVIVPFFNAERFIEEAIRSVFAQTCDQWELILVDDGSTDRSTAIARQYAQQHPEKVRYLEHEEHQNRGPSAARNLGILQSKGEYITFLDADDVWLPQKLAQQVAILESQPEAGMVYGLSRWWYSWTVNPEDTERDFVYPLGLHADGLQQPPAMIARFFVTQESAIPNPTNIMIRRAVVENVGGFEEDFRGKFAIYDDQAFFAKVALVSPIYASNTCWDYYRQHPHSICTVAEKEGHQIEARLFFLNWLARYLRDNGLKGTGILRSLRREIWSYRYPILRPFLKGKDPFMNQVRGLLWRVSRRMLPRNVRSWLRARWHHQAYIPPVGWVRCGDLRRPTPLSRDFGYDRGRPIDRFYIEEFLSEHQDDVFGRVLEVADDNYTRQFGAARVSKSDVLHLLPGNPKATIIADLTHADDIPSNTYDCVILTQTLQFILDVPAALWTVHRILRPGGVVLATFPGISPISRYDMDRWGQFWSFTSLSARSLFEQWFPDDQILVRSYGNVLAATAFLYGLAVEDFQPAELQCFDADYEVIVGVRAVKQGPDG